MLNISKLIQLYWKLFKIVLIKIKNHIYICKEHAAECNMLWRQKQDISGMTVCFEWALVPKSSRQQRVGWSDKDFVKGIIILLSNVMYAMILKI